MATENAGSAHVQVTVGDGDSSKPARGRIVTFNLVLPSAIAGVLGAAGAYGAHTMTTPEPQMMVVSRAEFDRKQGDFENRLRMLENDKIEAARWRQEISDDLGDIKKQSQGIQTALDELNRKDHRK